VNVRAEERHVHEARPLSQVVRPGHAAPRDADFIHDGGSSLRRQLVNRVESGGARGSRLVVLHLVVRARGGDDVQLHVQHHVRGAAANVRVLLPVRTHEQMKRVGGRDGFAVRSRLSESPRRHPRVERLPPRDRHHVPYVISPVVQTRAE